MAFLHGCLQVLDLDLGFDSRMIWEGAACSVLNESGDNPGGYQQAKCQNQCSRICGDGRMMDTCHRRTG